VHDPPSLRLKLATYTRNALRMIRRMIARTRSIGAKDRQTLRFLDTRRQEDDRYDRVSARQRMRVAFALLESA